MKTRNLGGRGTGFFEIVVSRGAIRLHRESEKLSKPFGEFHFPLPEFELPEAIPCVDAARDLIPHFEGDGPIRAAMGAD